MCVNYPKFAQFTNLEYGRGYEVYVKTNESFDITVKDMVLQDSALYLKDGLNLVGSIGSATSIEDNFEGLQLGQDYEDIYLRRNGKFVSYLNDDSLKLKNGEACFIDCLKDTVWDIKPEVLSTIKYEYNGDGFRTAKTVDEERTEYIYTPSWMCLYETTNGKQTSYVHGPKFEEILCQIRPDRKPEYLMHDHQMSVIGINCPNDVRLIDYNPFGEIRNFKPD